MDAIKKIQMISTTVERVTPPTMHKEDVISCHWSQEIDYPENNGMKSNA